MESGASGNILQTYRSKQQLMLFNEKPGQMNILDLKMNKIVYSTQLHNDEITSVTLNDTESTLVIGGRDGIIKIFNV